MPYQATVYKVMVASPSDVSHYRQKIEPILSKWNSLHSEEKGIVLRPILWEDDTHPEVGDHPQKIINRQILDSADILIVMFWSKLGLPTEEYPSGTVEELVIHTGKNKITMIYFCDDPYPTNIDLKEIERVREYKKEIERSVLYGSFNYKNMEAKISHGITRAMNNEVKNPRVHENNAMGDKLSKESKIIISRMYLYDEYLMYRKKNIDYEFSATISVGISSDECDFVNSDKVRHFARWEDACKKIIDMGFLEIINEIGDSRLGLHYRKYQLTLKGIDYIEKELGENTARVLLDEFMAQRAEK